MTKPAAPTLYPPATFRLPRAAAFLDISATTFARWVEEGTLPKPRVKGGIKLWLRSDLEEWAAKLPDEDNKTGWEDVR